MPVVDDLPCHPGRVEIRAAPGVAATKEGDQRRPGELAAATSAQQKDGDVSMDLDERALKRLLGSEG